MNTVVEVVIKKKSDPTAKKPWTCYGITLDDGRKASGFELVRVGDKVAVQENAKNPNFLDYRLSEGTDATPKAAEAPSARFNGGSTTGILDARQKAIIRQHSQSMAIEVLKIKQAAGGLQIEDLNPSKIRSLTDYFDKDVFDASNK